MKRVAWIILLAGSGVGLRAQPSPKPEPLTSDRPGYSDGVNVLSAAVLQLEDGISLSGLSNELSVDREFVAGSPTLRLGIGHRIELRLGGDGFLLHSHRAGGVREWTAGVSDLAVGAKFTLAGEHGFLPELALISMTSLPAGTASFTSSGIDPTLKLAWSKPLGENTTIAGNFNYSSLSDSSGRFSQGAVTFQLSRDLPRNWEAFGEVYLVAPSARGGDHPGTLDAGATHPLGRNAQFDFSAGWQIVPQASSWFVSAGLVVRRPVWHAGRQ